jgi:hypothetical protein
VRILERCIAWVLAVVAGTFGEGTALGWQELKANAPILLNRNKDQQQ